MPATHGPSGLLALSPYTPPSLLRWALSLCLPGPLLSPRLTRPLFIIYPSIYMHTSFIMCLSFIPSIQPFIHHPSTHPVIHPSSIHAFFQPSIYSSIHAASRLFIHPLSFQLTSTLHILVLSCFS